MDMKYIKSVDVADGRITDLVFNWGLEQRPLFETLSELPPHLAVRWVDRFAPLESLSAEWVLCMAYERAFGIQPPRKADWIRALQCEIQRVLWSCHYFANFFRVTENGYKEQIFWSLVDSLFSFQETLTGGRILPQSFRVGGVARDMSLGDLEKVRRMSREVESKAKESLQDLEEDSFFIDWLSRGLCLNQEVLTKLKVTGPNLHACGLEKDLRIDQPYGPYSEMKVRCYQVEQGVDSPPCGLGADREAERRCSGMFDSEY